MRNKLLLKLIFWICSLHISAQNNLVINPSAEYGNAPSQWPHVFGNFWTFEDAYLFNNHDELGIWDPFYIYYLSTLHPDSSDTCSRIITVEMNTPNNYFGSQQPRSGNGYYGVYATNQVICPGHQDWTFTQGKLILELEEELAVGCNYVIQAHFSEMDSSNRDPDYRILVAKGMDQSGGTGQNSIYADQFVGTKNSWQAFSWAFTPTTAGYKYLVIKAANIANPFNYFFTGFYIDDVSVFKTCDYFSPCDRNAVCPIAITATQSHISTEQGAQWKIFNLEGVTKVTTEIRNTAGQVVRTWVENSPYGFNTDLYFDGKGDNGIELANQVYNYTITAENSCTYAVKVITGQFDKTGIGSTPSPTPTVYSVYTPKPCCSGITDYWVDSVTIPSGSTEYIVQGDLYVGTVGPVVIEDGANVLFRGAYLIEGDNIETEDGATVIFETAPCPSQRVRFPFQISPIVLASNSESNNSENDKVLPDSSNYIVFPNPSRSIFRIRSNHDSKRRVYYVYDSRGAFIMTKESSQEVVEINLENYADGFFIVHVLESNGEIYTLRLIKTSL